VLQRTRSADAARCNELVDAETNSYSYSRARERLVRGRSASRRYYGLEEAHLHPARLPRQRGRRIHVPRRPRPEPSTRTLINRYELRTSGTRPSLLLKRSSRRASRTTNPRGVPWVRPAAPRRLGERVALEENRSSAEGRERRLIDLTATLEKVSVPAAIVDREGMVTWINNAARDVFGNRVGEPFVSLVAPEYIELVQRQLERKLSGEPATDYEVEVFTVDGTRRRAEVSSVLIPGGDVCHAVFGLALLGPPAPAAVDSVRLTPRQNEVLQLLGHGASTEDIASMFHLSKETVRNHVRHVLLRLGAHSRLEAVARAHELGLLGG
jgi:PAS domain S-box-containing protein